ncbi:MAG: hypothetical protein A3F91_02235 [Flavobacteria bacterium RIFCSPLOWO2_12_FULL_35_11]|nr:MAG: hypothetical protein A3F91_02235 [Flavobacteria bacterium RIFCSPLOWO2_12_FULL_35_11]
MKPVFFYLPALLFVLITGLSCCTNNNETLNHKQQIETFRKQKNKDYMIPEKTMLTADLMKDFEGLKYFPIDYKYNVKAELAKFEYLPKIEIRTSTGKVSDYVIYGKLSFTIDEKSYELSVYQSAGLVGTAIKENALFVPFTDKTSGKETYGGGRYLVLDIPENNQVTIDFNMAYNPFCVYNPKHSCPIPPAENNLPIKISVGEMMY